MKVNVFAWSTSCMLLLAACGEDEPARAPVVTPRPEGGTDREDVGQDGGDGGRADGGNSGGTDASEEGGLGADGGDGSVEPGDLAPLVRVLEPSGAAEISMVDPVADELVTGDFADVRCKAEEHPDSTEGVDPESVSVVVETLESDGPSAFEAAALPDGNDEYVARINLTDFPTGRLRITCTASDRSEEPLISEHVTYTFLDHGPRVRFISPGDGQHFAGTAVAVTEVHVTPARLSSDDSEADLASVTITVNGQEISAEELTVDGDTYSFEVAFTDPDLFPSGLLTATIEVVAVNGRTPVAVQQREVISVNVDNTGPTIEFDSPDDQDVVAGEVTVVATVIDAGSGVDFTTVRIRVNAEETVAMERNGDTYTHTFATGRFNPDPQINLEILARDAVGNENQEDLALFLDNVKPWISMDPPTFRVMDARTGIVCSPEFDPLGGEPDPWTLHAPDDGDATVRSVMLRALVIDRTNYVAGSSSVVYSDIEEGSVEVFIQNDLTVPLLVDTNDDGICDDINADPGASLNRPVAINLEPIDGSQANRTPSDGSLAFDGSDPPVEEPVLANGITVPPAPMSHSGTQCEPYGGGPQVFPQEGDCNDAPMFVLRHPDIVESAPVVYVKNPADDTGQQVDCRGESHLIVPNSEDPDNWVCIATRAVDNAGNIGISAPHRLCIDSHDTVPPECGGAAEPPGCTDGCLIEAVGAHGTGEPKDVPEDVSRIIRLD